MSAPWRRDPRTCRPPSAPRSSTSGRATASSTPSSARARGRRRWPWRWPPTTGIAVHVHHDERSGGFLALGLAAASGEAVVVLTTSGTAAVELHPAVVEADLAGVPLLVCTANRPPELHDVGAPQAIDQTPPVRPVGAVVPRPGRGRRAAADRWRSLAARAHAEATGTRPGPVHLNLAFREPLVGTPGELPPARPTDGAWVWRPSGGAPLDAVVDLAGDLAGHRGLIVAGAGSGQPRRTSCRSRRALGWPVLAVARPRPCGARR